MMLRIEDLENAVKSATVFVCSWGHNHLIKNANIKHICNTIFTTYMYMCSFTYCIMQSTLVISSLISNNHLSRSENMVPF